ncbi:MAG TPA: cobyrinic acid a,c-diamide synthase, partial [Stellaceae bacterium]|nr:cobyrinic acid a,c-diamide synthase [Stellaceae bacterium]
HLPEMPVLGALPAAANFTLPARHLGLVPAAEADDTAALIGAAAAQIAETVDIERLVAIARPSCRALAAVPATPLPPLGRHIAVAHDDAFLFTYEATLGGWRAQGASISFFSPLADEPPAPDADAVYLPGGYPELHAGRLASAVRFLGGLRAAADAGNAIYGECGGYMVLGGTLTDAGGTAHRMAGLLPLATSFASRRRHLGYRAVTLLSRGPLGNAGARFRGHEFHYASIVAEGDAEPLVAATDASGADLGHAGLRRGSVAGSFIHLIDRAD